MSSKDEIKKYLEPVLVWINRQLGEVNKSAADKKKLILFREFVKEQLPSENPHTATR